MSTNEISTKNLSEKTYYKKAIDAISKGRGTVNDVYEAIESGASYFRQEADTTGEPEARRLEELKRLIELGNPQLAAMLFCVDRLNFLLTLAQSYAQNEILYEDLLGIVNNWIGILTEIAQSNSFPPNKSNL